MKSCTCLARILTHGCQEASVPGTVRCQDHLEPDDMLALAEEYAVASIIYYGGSPGEFMSDGRFDGTCRTLLKAQAWRQMTWLEREALIAGTGYDTKVFPHYLHRAAAQWVAGDVLVEADG